MVKNIRRWIETRREDKLYYIYRLHLQKVIESISSLCQQIENWIGGNNDRVEELSETVSDIEEQADHLRREITDKLSRGAVSNHWTADDLVRISRRVDRVADHAKAASKNVFLLCDKKIPQQFREGAGEMAQAVHKEIKTLGAAIELLQEVSDVNQINALLDTVEHQEHEMDKLYFNMKQDYFEHLTENISAPIMVILHALFHNLESAADVAEDAADIIRSILATRR